MWRPNEWKNPYKGVRGFNPFDTMHLINKRDTFEAGADAMYQAIIDEIIRVEYDTLDRLGVDRLTDEQAVLFIESLRRHLTETEDGNY